MDQVVVTYVALSHVKLNSALIAVSSIYFIVFRSRSVQADSSTSLPFALDPVDGKGRMYSEMTCSARVLQ